MLWIRVGTVRTAFCCGLGVALAASAALAGCLQDPPGEPRTLVLALDGVPFRVFERARSEGLFDGWPEPVPLISVFPSLTNVAFTAILEPAGVSAADGYEVQRFDLQANRVIGGTPFGYKKRIYPWRRAFDVTGRSFGSKVAVYTGPGRKARKEWSKVRRFVMESDHALILAHIGGTDAMYHLRGDAKLLRYLEWLEPELRRLKQQQLQTTGQPLRMILLSDHGNTDAKVRKLRGVRRRLRKAGFRTVRQLKRPQDVVAVTFGIVNYGALYTREENARRAAQTVVDLAAVEVAVWRSGPDSAEIVSADGEAQITWRGTADEMKLRYTPRNGDPLELGPAIQQLRESGLLDAEGFASDETWFTYSAQNAYPDALSRLVSAMEGTFVANRATVLFSIAPGYAWGWTSAHISSKLGGGRLEGTHGGLDRDSTLGFFQSEDPALQPLHPVRATNALRVFRGGANCPDAANEATRLGAR